jgi:predicted nuclease of restriction endonuclease-like (RecB) superfamily
MNEAADQNWGTRALDRQIGTLYYERLLVSQDRNLYGRKLPQISRL